MSYTINEIDSSRCVWRWRSSGTPAIRTTLVYEYLTAHITRNHFTISGVTYESARVLKLAFFLSRRKKSFQLYKHDRTLSIYYFSPRDSPFFFSARMSAAADFQPRNKRSFHTTGYISSRCTEGCSSIYILYTWLYMCVCV